MRSELYMMVTTSNYVLQNDIKLETTEAYLLNLGKNLSWDFKVIYIFCKNAVLNHFADISKVFNVYKKINIFWKFDRSLLKIPKLIEIGVIFPAEKRE